MVNNNNNMNSVNRNSEPLEIDDFKSCPITRDIHQYRRRRILDSFPELNKGDNEDYLSLWKFIEGTPERYFSQESFESVFYFLDEASKADPLALKEILERPEWIPDIAFRSLAEINAMEFNDSDTPSNEYEMVSFCENNIHPAYLRLVESCFSYFIFPIAAFQRTSRKKPLDGLDLHNRVDELAGTKYSFLADYYNSVVRNAIAHGGVVYKHTQIIYKEKSKSVSLGTREIVNYFDNLLDICNGLSLGYRIFFSNNRVFLHENKLHIPLPILVEELQAATEAPGWRIEGCVESEVPDNESQLIIFSNNTLLDPMKLTYHVVRSAILCETFAPGYSYYFFNLTSRYSLLGFAGFRGKEISRFRKGGLSEDNDLSSIFDHRGISFNLKPELPRLFFRISTLFSAFRTTLGVTIQKIAEVIRPMSIVPRAVEIHRNGAYAVINCSVVLKWQDMEVRADTVKVNSKAIVKKAISSARKSAKITEISRYLRVGYARISLFSRDMRVRRLRSYGLGPELICTIQKKRLKRITAPDIWGGIPEEYKGLRIVWNKNSSIS